MPLASFERAFEPYRHRGRHRGIGRGRYDAVLVDVTPVKIGPNTCRNTLTSRRVRQEPLLGISWRRATKLRPTKRRVRQEPHFRPNWPGLAAVARGLAEIRPPADLELIGCARSSLTSTK